MTAFDLFEAAIREAFAERVQDDEFAYRLYGSLTNVEWQTETAGLGHTFRSAAGLIAEMRGRGETYIDFYCSSPEGVVDAEVAEALAARGYTSETDVDRWRPGITAPASAV